MVVDVSRGEPGKWNRFTITCKGKTVRTDRLGDKVLIEDTVKEAPARGPIRLESAGEASFCNLFIRELK
jgi:hypothetical protein